MMTKLFDLTAKKGNINEIIIQQMPMDFICKTRSIFKKKSEYIGFDFKIKYNSTIK